MKRTVILAALLGISLLVAHASDVMVRLTNPGQTKVVAATTNEVCLTKFNWSGKDSSGSHRILVSTRVGAVLVREETVTAIRGHGVKRKTNDTVIVTNRLPRTLSLGMHTVTVFRAEQQPDHIGAERE